MGPGPIMSAELIRLHQQDMLREAKRDRLAAEATAGAPTALARAQRGLLQLRNALLSARASGEGRDDPSSSMASPGRGTNGLSRQSVA